MSVFTFPLDEGQDREKLTALIQELANLTGSAVTIRDQISVCTNSTRLAIILKHLACDDPRDGVTGDGAPVKRRRARRNNGMGKESEPALQSG